MLRHYDAATNVNFIFVEIQRHNELTESTDLIFHEHEALMQGL